MTLYTDTSGPRLEEARQALARQLGGGTVGAPDAGGMLEVELSAASHAEALTRVREAITAAGVDDHFTFPQATGTGYRPPGERLPPPDERPPGPDPPHLERGGARENQPAPQDPPGPLQQQL